MSFFGLTSFGPDNYFQSNLINSNGIYMYLQILKGSLFSQMKNSKSDLKRLRY